MNRKFLRMTFLVRTILEENGKINAEEIQRKVLKKFEAYHDIKALRIDEYPDTTFEKDKSAIKDAWKIDLECHKNLYSINLDFESAFQNDLMNAAIFLSSLNSDMLLPDYVIPETRKNTGLEWFHKISHAIENNLSLEISYFDYISQHEKMKNINPYRLKQKDFKWYVLADDGKDEQIPFKSYALERIRDVKDLGKFKPKKIDFETPFQDAIGMFTNEEPVKIILEYDLRDGNYLKANPIHQSQKVIFEENKIIRFEFFLKPNEDFIMELMKRTWSLKVIEPDFLKNRVKDFWGEALKRNE